MTAGNGVVAAASAAELRRLAATRYRESVAEGEPLAPAALGAAFGRSRTWGRQVIAEARAATEAAVPEGGTVQEGGDGPEAHPAPGGYETAEAAANRQPHVPVWVGRVTTGAVLLVAVAAAVASVEHLAALAELAGTTGWRRWLLPAAVDGLAVAAALTLYGQHRGGARAGVLPWVALLAGLGASVVGNVASVYPELFAESHLRIGVGATPPLSLALAVELALRQVREVRA